MNKRQALLQLQEAVRYLNHNWTHDLDEQYPFQGDFNDVAFGIDAWVERHTRPTDLTLEVLKVTLGVDDEVEIHTHDTEPGMSLRINAKTLATNIPDATPDTVAQIFFKDKGRTFYTMKVFKNNTYEVKTHNFHDSQAAQEQLAHNRFLVVMKELGLPPRK